MSLPAHETGTCPSGDVTLHYRKFGQPGATPILIVHGLSYFSYDWAGVASALATDREVVAQDMRGFGDSTWSPDQDYSLGAFAGDIDTLLGHFGWDKAILIGHSMGGRNTTFYTSGHGDKVEKLILVDWSPKNAKAGSDRVTRTVAGVPDAFASVDAALDYFGQDKANPAVRARMEAYLKPVEGGFAIKRDTAFRDRFRKVLETGEAPKQPVDLWETLASIACPVLVVRGRKSDMFSEENAVRMKAENANLTLVELDTGHNVAGEDEAGLIREIRAFL
jgi:esterase